MVRWTLSYAWWQSCRRHSRLQVWRGGGVTVAWRWCCGGAPLTHHARLHSQGLCSLHQWRHKRDAIKTETEQRRREIGGVLERKTEQERRFAAGRSYIEGAPLVPNGEALPTRGATAGANNMNKLAKPTSAPKLNLLDDDSDDDDDMPVVRRVVPEPESEASYCLLSCHCSSR